MVTFSPLVDDTVATSKYSSRLGQSVELYVVHHTAGGTLESNTNALATNPNRLASVTYLLNTDAHLRGIVPEEYRPWTSGSGDVDRRAITQETINSGGAPGWPVADIQLEETAKLIADVAERYAWSKINRGNVIGHREVPAATACPGPYLFPRLDPIVARAVEIRGGATPKPSPAPKPTPAPKPGAAKIAEDGRWGGDTTGKAQVVLGTTHDRKVSGQPPANRSVLLAARNQSGWEWVERKGGSQLITEMMRIMQAAGQYRGKRDGWAGPEFASALCLRFNGKRDTRLDAPSLAVKRMQASLNEGKF